jgi:hypothetical protein
MLWGSAPNFRCGPPKLCSCCCSLLQSPCLCVSVVKRSSSAVVVLRAFVVTAFVVTAFVVTAFVVTAFVVTAVKPV